MDPLTLAIVTGAFAFRYYALSSFEEAAQEQRNAYDEYCSIRSKVLEERERCSELCHDLAVERQAAMAAHWGRLHTLLVACGANGGLFARSRQVFGEHTEEKIRQLIADAQLLLVGNKIAAIEPGLVATGVILLARSAIILDARHFVEIPALHFTMHDIAASLGAHNADSVLSSLDMGGLEVGDILGGVLTAIGVAKSVSIFSQAEECKRKARELAEEVQRLEAKLAELQAISRRALELFKELETVSYDLFKWTIVGQEVHHIRRSIHASGKRASDLPGWLLGGLLQRAAELWKTLEKSVFA